MKGKCGEDWVGGTLIGLMPDHCPDMVLVRHAPLSAHDTLKVKATAEVSASSDHLGM